MKRRRIITEEGKFEKKWKVDVAAEMRLGKQEMREVADHKMREQTD